MTDHKAEYEAALKLVSAQRCMSCEYCVRSQDDEPWCTKHDCTIPYELLYQPNDCAEYIVQIPF